MKNKSIKNQAEVRTSTMHLLLSSAQRTELDTLNTNHQASALKLQTTLYGFSGRVLDHKSDGMVVDGSKATKDQIAIYNIVCLTQKPKGLTNPILATEFKSEEKVAEDIVRKQKEYEELRAAKTSKMTEKEISTHNGEINRAKKRLETSQTNMFLIQQRKDGLLPISLSPENREHLRNNYQYDVMNGFSGRLRSWVECDAAAQTNYQENEAKLTALSSELRTDYSSEVFTEINDLLAVIKDLGERYTDVSYLNHTFLHFFRECWRPYALANNAGLLVGYSIKKDRDHSDVHVPYSFDSKVNDELFKRKTLWAPDKCILIDDKFYKYVELYDCHYRYRKQASLTLISTESPIPIGLSLDGNAAKLKRLDNDKILRQLTVTIELPNGDERSYAAVYGRRNESKCYYNDLEIRVPRSEKELIKSAKEQKRKLNDKEVLEASLDNCYIFEYARAGKIPVFATVKTLYIRRDPGNGEYYLILPTNVYIEHHMNSSFSLDETFKIRSKFQTSWKEIRNPNRTEQTCKLDKEIAAIIGDRTLKYAGIDLGYNNPYVIAHYDVTSKRNTIQWKSTGDEIVSLVPNEQYTQLKWDMRRLMDVLRITRRYLQGEADALDTLTEDTFAKLMPLLPVEQRVTRAQYIEYLQTSHKTGKLVKDLKGDRKWVIGQVMYNIVRTMKQLRGNRDSNGKITGNKNWLSLPLVTELVDTYYSLQKTFNMSGDGVKILPKDHVYAVGEKHRLTIREEDFCQGILEWRDNLKDQFIKKLFSQLAHRCHELGVNIVAMEDLEISGSVANTKDRNRMYNMWPRGQMKKYAEDAFGYMGIRIQYVDENGTSKHDSDSGIRGYRDGDDFYLPDGTKKHADVNAAHMIALRGLTHHTNIYKRKLVNVGNGYYVNAYELIKATKDQTNGSLRMRGAETRLNGYSATVYQTSDDGVSVGPKLNATTIINGRDIVLTKENTKSYYKMDASDVWYPWEVLKTFNEKMKKLHPDT